MELERQLDSMEKQSSEIAGAASKVCRHSTAVNSTLYQLNVMCSYGTS